MQTSVLAGLAGQWFRRAVRTGFLHGVTMSCGQNFICERRCGHSAVHVARLIHNTSTQYSGQEEVQDSFLA